MRALICRRPYLTRAPGTGEFRGGIFRFTQEWRDVPLDGKLVRTLVTDLSLVGGDFASCPSTDTRGPATISRRRTVRYMAAKAHGNFNTVGRNASGLERGTSWRTVDTCTTTEVHVSEGAVLVTDHVLDTTQLVRAVDTYIARDRPVYTTAPVKIGSSERLVLPYMLRTAGTLEVIGHHHRRPEAGARAASVLRPAPGRIVLARVRMSIAGDGPATARLDLTRAGHRMLRRNGHRLRVVIASRFTSTRGVVLETSHTVALREVRRAGRWILSAREAVEILPGYAR